jgi:hypothetical protein
MVVGATDRDSFEGRLDAAMSRRSRVPRRSETFTP